MTPKKKASNKPGGHLVNMTAIAMILVYRGIYSVSYQCRYVYSRMGEECQLLKVCLFA